MGSWDLARREGRVGTGNWEAWNRGIEPIVKAAKRWQASIGEIEKPWLCWNINDEWCKVQQKLVLGAGWTPIVGVDGNIFSPTVLRGAILVDFNHELNLPCMWMHFPLEFVFLFTSKLAFWHSDLLCSEDKMLDYANTFTKLKDGEMAAVKHLHGWFGFKDRYKNHYGELLGCTTALASKGQYENGCGWWRHVEKHPNSYIKERQLPYYEHGKGIWLWKKKVGGKIYDLEVNEKDGHGTFYKRSLPSGKSKSEEMSSHNILEEICNNLGITHLLE